jgi:iron complex outermembrane receptor protein
MTNVPRSFRTGIEVSMGAQLLKWLKWDLNSTFSLNKILDYTEYVDTYDSSWNFSGQTPVSLETTDISFSPGIIASNIFTFIPLKNLSLSLTSRYIGRQYIDNTSDRSRSLDPCFVNGLLIGYDLHTKVVKNIGFTLAVNNLFSQKYESSAWVYRYYQNEQAYESNGYFPQALIHFLAGITIKI